MNNEVIVLFGAGSIGEAIVRRVAAVEIYCWQTIMKQN